MLLFLAIVCLGSAVFFFGEVVTAPMRERRSLLTRAAQYGQMRVMHGRELPRFRDNEQLEFLGDAVLGFVISRVLYERFPHFSEGQLSKLRAYVVSARHLIKVARRLQLDRKSTRLNSSH